jgi:hypothetical protein
MALIESSFVTQARRLVVRVDGEDVPARAVAFSEADRDGAFDCSIQTPSWLLSAARARQAEQGQARASVAYPGLVVVTPKAEAAEAARTEESTSAALQAAVEEYYGETGLRS